MPFGSLGIGDVTVLVQLVEEARPGTVAAIHGVEEEFSHVVGSTCLAYYKKEKDGKESFHRYKMYHRMSYCEAKLQN